MIFTEFKNTLTRHEIDTAQTITKGTLVSLDYTSNKLKAGISNGSNILGIAQESGTAGDFIYVATSGTAEGATNLVVGETCWSDSNGVLFPDSTAVANSAGYFVGICVSTTEVRIDMKTFTPIPVIDPGLLQNYIANPIAKETSDVTAWNVYDDSSAIPVDGIGGTTSITLSQNITNPISSTGDFKLIKGASDLQGEGISYRFAIEPIHLAKVMQIEFNAKLFSGTYEKGDIRVYIIQDPNGTPKIIEPINVELELASIGNTIRYLGSFQTDYSELNYRLVIHIASTSALAYTIHFNNFKVWEPTKNYGAIITNWESYVPTIQGGGTLSGVNVKHRRVGSNLEIQGSLNLGTTSNSEFRMSLPNSLVISSDIIANQVIGKLNSNSISNSFYKSFNLLGIAAVSYLTLAVDSERDDILNAILPINSDSIESSSFISFMASIPIQGWGSNMALSSDVGDGSVVAALYTNSVYGNITNPWIYSNKVYDTHNAYNPIDGTFKAPVDGIYNFKAINISLSITSNCFLNVNGVTTLIIGNISPALSIVQGSAKLKKGDIVTINTQYSDDILPYPNCFIAIDKLSSGSQVIARDESVNAKMYVNNGFGISNSEVQIPFNIVEFDTHGICDINTGSITIPISGKYHVVCNISHDGLSSTNQSTTHIKKNGGLITSTVQGFTGWNHYYNTSAIIEAKSTDIITVSIEASQSVSSSLCDVSIYRIGN
jgi:hypothetical protein